MDQTKEGQLLLPQTLGWASIRERGIVYGDQCEWENIADVNPDTIVLKPMSDKDDPVKT